MSDREKEIMRTMATALPNMSDRDKGYILGYAEAMASQNKEKEKAKGEEEKE